MSSKYASKQSKNVTKQTPMLKELNISTSIKYPNCTNCGQQCSVKQPQYIKCKCGGSYQLLKSPNE